MKHLHLDAVGGVAGDMFIAALLDAFPEHVAAAVAAAEALSGARCQVVAHNDGVLAGTRFRVDQGELADDHPHVSWQEIRSRIANAALPEGVRGRAIAIFEELAQAEAKVHGVAAEDVEFHEVGAADSLADIVGAAWLIETLGPVRWSVSPLPLGGGRVMTAHGPLPVPAPATALLMEGFATLDDGIQGERITPTGAAILRHLRCVPRPRMPGQLGRSGVGFGTVRLNGLSNVLRVLVFDDASDRPALPHRELAVINFEVDDQPAEDLAVGLDHLRALPNVHDVLQMPALGKKGRMAIHVQVLTPPEAAEAVAEACFRETSTIGLRVHVVQGWMLARESREVVVESGRWVRVKVIDRPGGRTGKAEVDDAADLGGQRSRMLLRRAAERLAGVEEDV